MSEVRLEVKTCESCGREYPRNRSWSYAHFAGRKYCTRACAESRRPSIALDYSVSDSGCWEWGGHVDRNGYGKCYDPTMPRGRRVDWAHRASYRLHVGPIPDRHEIDHLCQNTLCMNPSHLEPVLKAEHVRRTLERAGMFRSQGRAASLRISGLTYKEIAQICGMASKSGARDRVLAAIKNGLVGAGDVPDTRRLDHNDRDDIRALYALGVPQTEIAAWYEVHSAHVSRICSGKNSGHDSPELARVERAL